MFGLWEKADTRGCGATKKCFVSLAEMTLTLVTFSPASHHSVLFFILSEYTSATEIKDLLVLSALSKPFGAQPFHQGNKVQSEIPLIPRENVGTVYKDPKETIPYV